MNERIRELANIACNRDIRTSPALAGDLADWKIIEEFAELIVQECANWMNDEKDENGDRIGDSFYWSDRMKKHFGVES